MSILSVPLKSGRSLYSPTNQLKLALALLCHLLITPVLTTAKRLSRSRYVHPKASLSANGARTLDLETKDVGGICWRWHVDIA